MDFYPFVKSVVAAGVVLGATCACAQDGGASEATQPAASEMILEDMFVWWNAAYLDEENGFTREAFSRFYTDDAVMRINGRVTVRGIDNMVERFRGIQQRTEAVEIIVPFEEKFISREGDKIFTYHLARSRENGQEQDSYGQIMGYAEVRNGKISVIDFVSIDTPQQDSLAGE